MPNKNISGLTSISVPLAGTEVIPIWNGVTTTKVPVANLTAGRAVSMLSATIAGGIGTTEAPAYTSINFTGYLGNRTAVVRSYDQSGSSALGGGLEILVNSNMAADVVALAVKMDAYGNIALNTGNLAFSTAGKGIDFSAKTGAPGMTSKVLVDYEEGTWTPNQGNGLVVVGAFSSSARYTRIGRQVTVTGNVLGATSISVGNAYAIICTNLPFGAGSGVGVMYNGAANESGVVLNGGNILYSATTMSATGGIAFNLTYTL